MRIQEYLTCAIQNMQVLIAYASEPKKAAAARLLVVQRSVVKAFESLRVCAILNQNRQSLTICSGESSYQYV